MESENMTEPSLFQLGEAAQLPAIVAVMWRIVDREFQIHLPLLQKKQTWTVAINLRKQKVFQCLSFLGVLEYWE